MPSENKDDAVHTHAICITIKSKLKNRSAQAIAHKCIDAIVPKIVDIVAGEILTILEAFEQALDESTEGGEK